MGAIPDRGIVSRNSADWITDMLQILNERFGIERQVKSLTDYVNHGVRSEYPRPRQVACDDFADQQELQLV